MPRSCKYRHSTRLVMTNRTSCASSFYGHWVPRYCGLTHLNWICPDTFVMLVYVSLLTATIIDLTLADGLEARQLLKDVNQSKILLLNINLQVYFDNANDRNYSLTKIHTLIPVVSN